MKHLLRTLPLLLLLISSCSKQEIEEPIYTVPTDCSPMFSSYNTEWKRTSARPVAVLAATALNSSSIRLSWKKRGSSYNIYRDGIFLRTVSTTSYVDSVGLSPNTTYTYQVVNNEINITATATTLASNTPPPSGGPSTMYLDFDGETISGTSWNHNGDFYATPSGLTEDEQQVVLAAYIAAYDTFPVTITIDESIYKATPSNRRQRVVFTEYYEWFGSAGGVAFVSSWGTRIGSAEQPCFVFTSLLAYRVKDIIFAGVHEAGHTLGLYHAVDFSGQSYSNGPYWMGGSYQWQTSQYLFRALGLDSRGNTVCEPCVINQTLI
jgi:hypothetical protein